jgi:hypothetical protein
LQRLKQVCAIVCLRSLVMAIHAGPTVRVLETWRQRRCVDARDKPVHDGISGRDAKP